VVRYPYGAGELQAQGPGELALPLPAGGAVWRRSLARAGDGSLYVSVGASCDACDETDPRRAAVLRHEGGRPLQAYSLGLRGVGGLAIEPRTGGLWATDQGRGGLGEHAPPDELNLLAAGGHFGWPQCYGARTPDASQEGSPTGCAATLAPAVSFGARTEPMGLAFGHGARLPPEWRDDLFVALHGASSGFPVGFKVVRVPFAGGVPAGDAVDLVSGWLRPDTRRWGRPIDVMVAADGALLIADEGGHRVYRLGYEPATPVPTPVF
jgi:glucose/arabinose dehydrogenase